jgi:hypothetical protein
MILILGLERLLGWERLPLYGRFGYIEMTKFLMIKICLSCRSSTGLFMVTSLEDGESRPIYGCLYNIGGDSEGYFFPTWVAA